MRGLFDTYSNCSSPGTEEALHMGAVIVNDLIYGGIIPHDHREEEIRST